MPTGEIKMNPLGPHFYVDSDAEVPPNDADIVTDRMNHLLQEMDANHSWDITHSHIKGHTTITTVEWTDADRFSDIEWDIKPFDVDEDWYSRTELHDWNF